MLSSLREGELSDLQETFRPALSVPLFPGFPPGTRHCLFDSFPGLESLESLEAILYQITTSGGLPSQASTPTYVHSSQGKGMRLVVRTLIRFHFSSNFSYLHAKEEGEGETQPLVNLSFEFGTNEIKHGCWEST